jgi:hypothetical protein
MAQAFAASTALLLGANPPASQALVLGDLPRRVHVV